MNTLSYTAVAASSINTQQRKLNPKIFKKAINEDEGKYLNEVTNFIAGLENPMLEKMRFKIKIKESELLNDKNYLNYIIKAA